MIFFGVAHTDMVSRCGAAKYESFAKRVEAAQLEEIEKAGRKGTFVFKHVMGKANYADVLCDFAYEKQADVLVVGHGGQSAKKRPPRAGEQHTPTAAS